ncbi:MAG: hypothetical protein AB8H03_02355 [Saprospiraceae bacterium]
MKTIKPLLLFFSILLALQKSYGQNYQFFIDPNFSSISSAESLSSIHHILNTTETSLFPNKIGKNIKSKFGRKVANLGYRFGKLMVLEVPIDGLIMMNQYVIFGYGYRYRTHGYLQNRFVIDAPLPYGKGSGSARQGTLKMPRTRSTHELITFYSGGIESTKILNNTISKRWILSDSIHFREAMLCVRAFNKTHYPLLFLKNFTSPTYDLQYYISNVNNFYGYQDIDEWKLTPQRFRKISLLNFLNPFVGFAFLTSALDYGWYGRAYGKLRWFRFGKVRYLPSVRIGLTPFGDEVYFESFFKKSKHALRFYYRHGNPVFEKSNGFGVETFNAFNFSGKIKLDFQLDIWSQPELELGGETIRLSSKGLGNLMKVNFQVRLFNISQPVYLSGQFGYKTDGFIEGEPLRKGIILRGGFSYDFGGN